MAAPNMMNDMFKINLLEICYLGVFSESLITNPMLFFPNSKWRTNFQKVNLFA